jgi:hypothetical protein
MSHGSSLDAIADEVLERPIIAVKTRQEPERDPKARL